LDAWVKYYSNFVEGVGRHRHLSFPVKILTLPAIAKCFAWKHVARDL
jgi:hypothetical protein